MSLPISFYIFLAIYLSAITVEAVYSYYTKKGLYNVKDTLVNIFLGVSGVITRVLTKGAWLALWIYLYQFSLIKITESIWSWLLLRSEEHTSELSHG